MADATDTTTIIGNQTNPLTNTTIQGTPPPPPRTTGSAQSDLPILIDWLWKFYTSVVTAEYYLTTSSQQLDDGNFDPSTLPDPSTSTIPQAQLTANNAYVLAQAAKVEADKLASWQTGQIVFADTAAVETITFGTNAQQPDTKYKVFLTVANITGTPATNSLFPVRQTLGKSSFSVNIAVAPGTGNTVTYNYMIARNI